MERIKTIISYGVAAAIPVAALNLQACKEKSKPNVIFILLDELGYTDLACYGSRFYETPNIGSPYDKLIALPFRQQLEQDEITITEMTGSDAGKAEPDGISFTPLFKVDNLPERPLFWHYPHYSNQGGDPGSAVRLGKYKLIDNFVSGRQELYDLEADISETRDISSSNPGKTKELFDILNSWRKATDAKMMEPNPKWNGDSGHSSE